MTSRSRFDAGLVIMAIVFVGVLIRVAWNWIGSFF